ncbi:MAG: hypothetical protein ITG00_03320, partial [Flavobacterium sp.]|nr:hypothetical protein [Flavobacterium sp.]
SEFANLEAAFSAMVGNTHKKFTVSQIRTFYGTVTSEIFTLYPMPLLDAARRLKITNEN